MRFKTALLALLLLFQFQAFSQQTGTDIVIGQKHTLSSVILGSDRTMMVSLPEGYSEDEEYPVLYLLDGQKWFMEAISLRKVLRSYDYVPSFIIVGIQTDDQPRYGFFNNAPKLQSHLEEELIPYIEKQYNTSSQRMISGWQFASGFVIQTMAQKPQLFDGWFAASPIPIEGVRNGLVKQRLIEGSLKTGTLVFATSQYENGVEGGARELEAVLKENAPASFRWKYAQLTHEEVVSAGHRTTPLGTLYQGLRTYFEDYPVLEFNTLADYKAAGGYGHVERYYQQRSEAYGFSNDIPEEGMFFLVRMCLDANEPSDFHFFMQKFKDTSFFKNNNLGWNMRFANFYLDHEQHENALTQYNVVAEIFPESPRPVLGMAKAYAALGDKTNALAHYEKAIAMAEASNDRNLSRYQKELEDFKKGQ